MHWELRKGKRWPMELSSSGSGTANHIVSFSFFVRDTGGSLNTTWWNSKKDGASHIDFLNSTAKDWFHARLKTLQTSYGIDSFKFDGGEVDLIPWVRIA